MSASSKWYGWVSFFWLDDQRLQSWVLRLLFGFLSFVWLAARSSNFVFVGIAVELALLELDMTTCYSWRGLLGHLLDIS